MLEFVCPCPSLNFKGLNLIGMQPSDRWARTTSKHRFKQPVYGFAYSAAALCLRVRNCSRNGGSILYIPSKDASVHAL